MALAGINDEELKRYMTPASYANEGDPLPNPSVNPDKPQMTYPAERLQMIASAPDDAFLNSVEKAPPSPNGL